MANQDGTPVTNEEILDALRDKVNASGVDQWTLKIFRRTSQGTVQMKHVATLGLANLTHIANIENWLPLLGGGGPNFVVECFHASEMTRPVKGRLNFYIDGDALPVPNSEALNHPQWTGPKKWIGPLFDGMAPPTGAGTPVWSSPATPAVGALQGRGSLVPNTGSPGVSVDPRMEMALARLEQRERELEEQKRKDAVERAERIAAEREREANRRIEEQAREHRREMEELRKSVATPQRGPSDIVAAATGALQPLLAMWMENMKTEREERRRLDEREREERKRADEARALQAAEERRRSDLLFQKLLEPKPLIDPMVEKLINKREDPSAAAEVLSKTSGAMMRLMQFAMSTVQDKDPENPTTALVKEVVQGLQGFMATLQPPQVQVIGVPPPTPAPTSYPQQAAPAQQHPQNGGTGPQQPMDVNDPKIPLINRIVERVRRLDDAKILAVDIIDALDEDLVKDDSVRVALNAAKGDLTDMFRKYVGDDFAVRNQTYAMSLGAAIEAEWKKRGAEEEAEAEVIEEAEAEAQAEA